MKTEVTDMNSRAESGTFRSKEENKKIQDLIVEENNLEYCSGYYENREYKKSRKHLFYGFSQPARRTFLWMV